MQKSAFTPEGEAFRRTLRDIRAAAGLNQRQLAAKIKVAHSSIARMELGERRVDVVEFCWICQACGVDAAKAVADTIRAVKAAGRRKA